MPALTGRHEIAARAGAYLADETIDDILLHGIESDWLNRLVNIVREIQASEAKTHLPQLLDDVERGETVIITRHGRPIARLVPESDHRRAEIDEIIASLEAKRREARHISVEDLLSAREEGRKR